MQDKIKTWLYDVLNAIVEIESFVNISDGFAAYQNDLKSKRAVERNIEIIGEAMNRILAVDNSLALSHSRRIVDTRNRIIHGYDTVSDDIIWNLVNHHLPLLKTEVEGLLEA